MLRKTFSSVLALLFLLTLTLPSQAIVRMDTRAINHAIQYGIKNKNKGSYRKLLGPNWKEGTGGVLLNTYTPYMLLAAKAYSTNLSWPLSQEDMKKAKRALRRDIRDLKDEQYAKQVKFSLSLLGTEPSFAKAWSARVEGIGGGRSYVLKPKKETRTKVADKRPYGKPSYEAVNGYYFFVRSLERLDGDYQLILTNETTQETVSFTLNNEAFY